MLSQAKNGEELSNSSSAESSLYNTTHHGHPSFYAAQFPYTPMNESFVRQLVNFTIVKGDIIRTAFAGNTSFKHNGDMVPDDAFNHEVCVTHDNESAWFSTEFQATLHFMYITIFLIAIFGNGIVCFIVCTSSRMQTVTNFFIANLALSDMLMAFFCIPFSFISQFVLQ